MQPGNDCQKSAEQKTPNTKEPIVYYCIYVKFWNRQKADQWQPGVRDAGGAGVGIEHKSVQ